MQERGIVNLSDIARELGVSPQSVNNWKTRDQVPYKVVVEIQEKFGNWKLEIRNQKSESDHQEETRVQFPSSPIPNTQVPYYFEEDTISLSDIMLVLAKHIKLIILIPIIMVFFTLLYVQFIQQPLYISTAKLLLPENRESVSGMAGLAYQFGVQIPTGERADLSSATLYPELINSRTFAEKILNKSFYTEKYEQDLPLFAILTHGDEPPKVGRDTLIVMAMEALPEMIRFEEEGSFSVLEVEIFEPQLAADIANAVLEELEKLNRKFKSKHISEKRGFIEERISSVKGDLERSELVLKEFREANRQILNSPTLLLQQDRLARDVEIQKGVYLTLKQQLELAKIEEVQESSVVQILDYPIVPLAPSNKKTKLAVLLSGFLGVGLGVVLAFVKGYTEKADEEEKKKMGEIKSQFWGNVRSIIADRKITGLVTLMLLIGLPFLLAHESRNPEFFGRYSLKALIIVITYVVILIASNTLVILSKKLNVQATS